MFVGALVHKFLALLVPRSIFFRSQFSIFLPVFASAKTGARVGDDGGGGNAAIDFSPNSIVVIASGGADFSGAKKIVHLIYFISGHSH